MLNKLYKLSQKMHVYMKQRIASQKLCMFFSFSILLSLIYWKSIFSPNLIFNLMYVFNQFSVTLVSEEELQEDCKGRTKQSITTVAYNKHHEFSLHLSLTQIILPIPLTITPAFSTNIGNYNCLLITFSFKFHSFFFSIECSIYNNLNNNRNIADYIRVKNR